MTKTGISVEQLIHDFGAPLTSAIVVAVLSAIFAWRKDVKLKNLEKKHQAYERLLETAHFTYLDLVDDQKRGFAAGEESGAISKQLLEVSNLGQIEVLSKMYSNADVDYCLQKWSEAVRAFRSAKHLLHNPPDTQRVRQEADPTLLQAVVNRFSDVGDRQAELVIAVRRDLKLHQGWFRKLWSRFVRWIRKNFSRQKPSV